MTYLRALSAWYNIGQTTREGGIHMFEKHSATTPLYTGWDFEDIQLAGKKCVFLNLVFQCSLLPLLASIHLTPRQWLYTRALLQTRVCILCASNVHNSQCHVLKLFYCIFLRCWIFQTGSITSSIRHKGRSDSSA